MSTTAMIGIGLSAIPTASGSDPPMGLTHGSSHDPTAGNSRHRMPCTRIHSQSPPDPHQVPPPQWVMLSDREAPGLARPLRHVPVLIRSGC